MLKRWLDARTSNVEDITRKVSFLLTGVECSTFGRMIIKRFDDEDDRDVKRQYFDRGTFGTISLLNDDHELNVVSKRYTVRRDDVISEYDIHKDLSYAVLTRKCIHFPLLYFATKSFVVGRRDRRSVELVIEKFDGNFLDYDDVVEGTSAILCILYQLLRATYDMHYKCGIYHRDIKLDNILFRRIASKQFLMRYDADCVVENTCGVVPIIADFGSAWSVWYRNDLKSRFSDVVYERVIDDDGGPISAMKRTKHKRLAIRSNLMKYPPLDFVNDVQDVIRLFTGGKRTSMPNSDHDTFKHVRSDVADTIRNTCFTATENLQSASIIDAKYFFANEALMRIKSKFERRSRTIRDLEKCRCCDKKSSIRDKRIYVLKLINGASPWRFELVSDAISVSGREIYINTESTRYSDPINALPRDVNSKVKKSLLLQILDGVRYLHETYGLAHNDLMDNVRYSLVDEGERVSILNDRLEIPTYGYYATIWNFDKATSFKPKYSLDGFYGTRNATYAHRMCPINVEGNSFIEWKWTSASKNGCIKSPSSEIMGTYNEVRDFRYFTADQLNDTIRYPAFEFRKDIADVFRLFDDTIYYYDNNTFLDTIDVYNLRTSHLAVVASARIKHIVNKQKSC